MPLIHIGDKTYEAPEGQNLLRALLSLGFDIPYFCWHPMMGSVGACRQCAVKLYKDEHDTKGKIVMSCMTPVAGTMRVSIDDPEVRAFRASVIEWLMINHPHDCPVCDEGGECHLQDMTVMTGHVARRYRFTKRTYRNQNLGPFVNHEMNRCIQCYRCIRFYNDFAGGRDLGVFASHDHVYFGRASDGVLESEFSGNLVEVCPTGVFTDKTLKKHYTRKWDLQTAPSICVHCGLGCNIIPGERYGTLRRIRNRYNGEVNGYFICDLGRYGYEFVNSPKRLRKPMLHQLETTHDAIVKHIAELFKKGQTIGIGSPRASLESNYALRELVGAENFYHGVSDTQFRLINLVLDILRNANVPIASMRQVSEADAVLILGEDLTNIAPRLDFAVRQASRQKPMKHSDALKIPRWHEGAVREVIKEDKGPIFIATPAPCKLDAAAQQSFRLAPDDIARFGFAVASALDVAAPKVPNLSEETRGAAQMIAAALKEADHPLIIAGTSLCSEAILQAAANLAIALKSVGKSPLMHITVPDCNSMGLAMLGGKSLSEAFERIGNSKPHTISAIILETDLHRHALQDKADDFINNCSNVISLDYIENRTTAKANVILPSATFAESQGTLISSEGRAQRFFSAMHPKDAVQESWRWLQEIREAIRNQGAVAHITFDELFRTIAASLPEFAPITMIAPDSSFRIVGQKIARQSPRYSGRTAMNSNVEISETPPPKDPDSPLSYSMEGFSGIPPAPLIPRFWSPGWNSENSVTKFQAEINGPLQGGDPGIRLINLSNANGLKYFQNIPNPFTPKTAQFLFVPLHNIFGSSELGHLSSAIAERIPSPFLIMNQTDAMALKILDKVLVNVELSSQIYSATVNISEHIPKGMIGLSNWESRSPDLRLYVDLPQWGKLAPTPKDDSK